MGRSRFDRFFSVTERGSTYGREINGGIATFLAVSYIVVLNPIILSGAPADDTPGFAALAATTALVAAIGTLLMALLGRAPFAVAAGLGINGIIAFQLAPVFGYGGAMALVVLEGIVTLILVLLRVREALFRAIPRILKGAIGAGIGAFLVLIGLVDGGIVKGSPLAPSLNLQPLNTWPRLVFVLVLIALIVMLVRKWRGAIIGAIIGGTVLAMIIEGITRLGSAIDNPAGWVLNVPVFRPDTLFVMPDLSAIGRIDFGAILFSGWGLLALALAAAFSLLLADLFDTMGTIVAVGQGTPIMDGNGDPKHLRGILAADSLGAILGGLGGVSSNTTYIESAAGVRSGARTGVASLVTSGLFVLAIFVSPLAQLVPSEAAAPVLVVVGGSMVWGFVMSAAQELRDRLRKENEMSLATTEPRTGMLNRILARLEYDWEAIAAAAVLTILVMPFTYSITNGIGVGFITYVVAMLAARKARDIHPLMWVMAVAFVLYFALPLIQSWFGV